MSSINFHTKEISAKIVFYGPGLCGKTTSLQRIYSSIPEDKRPQIVSLATEVDRTIFFDFLPVAAYKIRDFTVRLQLYTVPGQVFYNATRKLVLNGVDGVVFVADSQHAMRDSNLESLQNLQDNLSELGLDVARIPLVMEFNKRDLVDIETIDEMNRLYNKRGVPAFATVATTGEGLFDVLKSVSQVVVNDLIKKGLGRQLKQRSTDDTGEIAQEDLASAVSRAAAATPQESVSVPQTTSSTSSSGLFDGLPDRLWPTGALRKLALPMMKAFAGDDFEQVLLASHALLEQCAKNWARSVGESYADPLPYFLLQQGVSVRRYKQWKSSLSAVRGGKALQRNDASNALILALDVLW